MGKLFILFLAISIGSAEAGQTRIPDYETARDDYFYDKLYPNGGWTFYCGYRWPSQGVTLNVEHIVPASWMKTAAGCSNNMSRQKCRNTSQAFNYMEADLHNLYAALAFVNQARSNYPFGEISGEQRLYQFCDFERVDRVVEPKDNTKGNIARAHLYMAVEYGVQYPPGYLDMMKRWHFADPPSAHEVYRNNQIGYLQRKRNRFIDNPGLANSLP